MNFFDWLGLTANGEALAVGAVAPQVVSRDENDREVHLADVYRNGVTLVYFSPKADTPGCTAQACSLRDGFEELQSRGVQIIGVSSDKPAAQRRFKDKYKLPFTLLADFDHVVAKAFGVRLIIGFTRRQSFLIKDGKIVWRDLHASTREQASDVLRILEKLS